MIRASLYIVVNIIFFRGIHNVTYIQENLRRSGDSILRASISRLTAFLLSIARNNKSAVDKETSMRMQQSCVPPMSCHSNSMHGTLSTINGGPSSAVDKETSMQQSCVPPISCHSNSMNGTLSTVNGGPYRVL